MHPFVDAWRRYEPQQPHVLPGDEFLLECTSQLATLVDWDDYTRDPDFGQASTPQLHLNLLPMPFVGNLERATVFLLMLNPGLAPTDYYGEFKVPTYRAALLNNLKQLAGSPFLFLDPTVSWHGGFLYWHSKLSKLIAALARHLNLKYGQARKLVQDRVAVIELVPYHSQRFGVPSRIVDRMKSVKLARSFALEHLVPRAKSGQCLIVATRARSLWRLPEHDNIITYSGSEARGAHLSANTRGGKAILAFLCKAADAV